MFALRPHPNLVGHTPPFRETALLFQRSDIRTRRANAGTNLNNVLKQQGSTIGPKYLCESPVGLTGSNQLHLHVRNVQYNAHDKEHLRLTVSKRDVPYRRMMQRGQGTDSRSKFNMLQLSFNEREPLSQSTRGTTWASCQWCVRRSEIFRLFFNSWKCKAT